MTDRALIARILDEYGSTDTSGESEEAIPWLLHALVVAVRPLLVVEIGSYTGLSSMAIAAGLKQNEELPLKQSLVEWNRTAHPAPGVPVGPGVLYCIDPFRHERFDSAARSFGLSDRIHFIEKTSDEVDPASLPVIDLLFIDGMHSYEAVRRDFERFSARVKHGGLILIHDVFPDPGQHGDESKAWWGPSLFVRQLREGVELGDFLWVDTHFPSVAIFRKRVAHIDYPFLTTSGLIPAAVQFIVRRTLTAPRWLPLRVALTVSGSKTSTRRWRLLRWLAHRMGLRSWLMKP